MRPGRAIAGLVFLGLAALLVTGGWPSLTWSGSTEEHREGLDTGVRRVVLQLRSGDVRVATGDRAHLTTRVGTWWWARPDPTHRRDGATLVLTGCGTGCEVDYELVVPPGTVVEGSTGSGDIAATGVGAVRVDVGSGDVTVRSVAGAVSVGTGSGGIRLTDVSGRSALHTSSGSIRGTAVAAPVTASASSGDVTLELARAQDLRARTSSGDVEVTVPAGRYRVSSSGDGEVRSAGVVHDPAARYLLELGTASGDIVIGTP